MANRTKNKSASSVNAARAAVAISKPKPWGTIIAILAVLALAGGVFGYAFTQIHDKTQWLPTESQQDPSLKIPGIVNVKYDPGKHVKPTERVAYDQSPPFGGPHDGYWADCDGLVYPKPVRSENMVHALEHGAVWIAYNPDKVQGAELDKLKKKVEGQPFSMLSPYPGLNKPISLQSWGHQLKLDSAGDPRIDQFISSLRRNLFVTPEPKATCDAMGPGAFDPDNPPPFDATPPGPDAYTMAGVPGNVGATKPSTPATPGH